MKHLDILADSQLAPSGCDSTDSGASDCSFEDRKPNQSADMSTDDEAYDSDELDIGFAPLIPGGSRLPIFQQIGQKSNSQQLKMSLQKLSSSSSTAASEEGSEAEQGLLKTLRLDEQHESWGF